MSTSTTEDQIVTPANKIIRDMLDVIADGYDSVRPGAGDCVREFAAKKYPNTDDLLQLLSNLCERHRGIVLPETTSDYCVHPECEEELKARRTNDPA